MHWRSRPNIDARIIKTEELFATRSRSFTFHYRPAALRIAGDTMTSVDFQFNLGAEIQFVHEGSTYTFTKADVRIVRRLRSRKYALEPTAVTIV